MQGEESKKNWTASLAPLRSYFSSCSSSFQNNCDDDGPDQSKVNASTTSLTGANNEASINQGIVSLTKNFLKGTVTFKAR